MFIFRLMRSRVILSLVIVSLLAAVTLGVFWVRSYGSFDAVTYSNIERGHLLVTVPGAVSFTTWNHLPIDRFSWEWISGRRGKDKLPVYAYGEEVRITQFDPPLKAGFRWERGQTTVSKKDVPAMVQNHLHAAVPFWLPVLLLLIGPALWGLKLWQRYQRALTGHCIYCNTPMPTPDQCPKCGAEFDGWVL